MRLVVNIRADGCLKRLIIEMTSSVTSGMLNRINLLIITISSDILWVVGAATEATPHQGGVRAAGSCRGKGGKERM